ncbi:MAG: hypothetical protein LBG80_12525 [Bacteroidales bacterium]|jgi:predicted DNA-binding protein (UPF0278 family)|nr:hypothetical protein [Bacteroidales bacterium]
MTRLFIFLYCVFGVVINVIPEEVSTSNTSSLSHVFAELREEQEFQSFVRDHWEKINSAVKSNNVSSFLKELDFYDKELLNQYPDQYIECMYSCITSPSIDKKFLSNKNVAEKIQNYFNKILETNTVNVYDLSVKLDIFLMFRLTVPQEILENEAEFSKLRKKYVSKILQLYWEIVTGIDPNWDDKAELEKIEPLRNEGYDSFDSFLQWKVERKKIYDKFRDQLLRMKYIDNTLEYQKKVKVALLFHYLLPPNNIDELVELLKKYKVSEEMTRSILDAYEKTINDDQVKERARSFILHSRFQ